MEKDMKTGKISEVILKRSVLKLLKNSGTKQKNTPVISLDAGRLKFDDNTDLLFATASMQGNQPGLIESVFHRAVNNIYAKGGEPIALSVALTLRSYADEQELKGYSKELNRLSTLYSIPVLSGETMVGAAVTQNTVTIHATGKVSKQTDTMDRQESTEDSIKEYQIVMSKYIGLSATKLLIESQEEKLKERLTESFLAGGKKFGELLSIQKEMEISKDFDIICAHDVSEGGIFAALWEVGDSLQCGLDISLDSILLRQETIEVCEALDLNPYLLYSGGCALFVTKQGEALIEALAEKGIEASVIGKTTNTTDRIVRKEDEIRYLEPFKGDEIYKGLYD
jgi:hydrogenase expression/formation protein HypE